MTNDPNAEVSHSQRKEEQGNLNSKNVKLRKRRGKGKISVTFIRDELNIHRAPGIKQPQTLPLLPFLNHSTKPPVRRGRCSFEKLNLML
ncbi:hypothetical protein NPIL_369131 [Nephila pilipes]|uniref:Uncharacterized protein n=1 Tax=Nephila pilipes TaxID=299642 RepID=A0A8X6MN66_NEPPI|nr:hypothetical protein NPIL_369131 [Nephila pilipes]